MSDYAINNSKLTSQHTICIHCVQHVKGDSPKSPSDLVMNIKLKFIMALVRDKMKEYF